jgi:hypothetical protein
VVTRISEPVQQRLARAEKLARAGADNDALTLLTAARSSILPERERYEIGEALLRVSNCRVGWEEYNLHPSWAVDRVTGVRPWDGTACRRVIVVADLGFGDTIMALRHVPALLGRAEQIVVAVHDALFDLVRSAPILAGTTVISKTQAQSTTWPDDARWERLFSLPGIVGTEAVRPMPAYLRVPVREPVVPKEPGEVIVGIAWRSTVRRGFPNRSIPLRLFQRLAEVPNVRLVCLHRDRDLRAVPRNVATVGIGNFMDTAAVMAQCDLVVTADTVTAHLAPALGVPTLIGLRHWPAWIWGTHRNPTRWYESAQLVFQDEKETWPQVMDEVKAAVVAATAVSPIARQGVR